MSTPQDSRNQGRQPQPSTEFLEALKYEMALTAETMNQELTALQNMGYIEALSDLNVEQVRAGFKRARRTLQFFPKPAEVRTLAEEEIEETRPKTYYLPEPEPMWTDEDRKKWVEDIYKVGGKKPPGPTVKPPSEEEWNQRREEQLAKLHEKFPVP